MKLELKHLAGYLPYGLKVQSTTGHITSISIEFDECDFCVKEVLAGIAKPILRQLSDLTKEIEVNGEKFVPYKKLNIESILVPTIIHAVETKKIQYKIIEKLYEWHFDIHNLIENNLAIDINTL